MLHKVQAHSSRHRHAAGNAMADALAVTATADPADAAAQGRQAAAQVSELCCITSDYLVMFVLALVGPRFR